MILKHSADCSHPLLSCALTAATDGAVMVDDACGYGGNEGNSGAVVTF